MAGGVATSLKRVDAAAGAAGRRAYSRTPGTLLAISRRRLTAARRLVATRRAAT